MLERDRQHGFTLTETMVSLLISGIVMAGVLSIFSAMTKNSKQLLAANRLERELSNSLQLMAADIQRAGYWNQAQTGNTNPYMVSGSTDIETNVANNCLLLTYDHDNDGTLPAINANIDDERYGFRLLGGAIQYRPAGAPFTCSAAANSWKNLTDPSVINISQLTFNKSIDVIDLDGVGPGTSSSHLRRVTITLTGHLVSDPSVTKTYSRTVRVYNDKYVP